MPARDVPAGLSATNNAWLDKFSVLRRDNDQGLDLNQAFARCTDAADACRTTMPALEAIAAGQSVRCLRWREL